MEFNVVYIGILQILYKFEVIFCSFDTKGNLLDYLRSFQKIDNGLQWLTKPYSKSDTNHIKI